MTSAHKQAILNMRRQGAPYSGIASAYGLSLNTVKSLCRRENVDVQNHPANKDSNRCKNCGALLKHNPGSKKRTFCCDKCRYGWWNKNREWLKGKGAYKLTCFFCGNGFESNNKKRKFCGRDCYARSRRGEGLP
jgi:hypothetical protein